MTINDFVAGWITVLSSFMAIQQYRGNTAFNQTHIEWMNELNKFLDKGIENA